MRYEIDKESKAEEGKVIVTFYDDYGNIRSKEHRKIVTSEEIYAGIAKGNKVDLDFCYVETFLSNRLKNIDVEISAKKTLFRDVSFEDVSFSERVDFYGAVFLRSANFAGASFAEQKHPLMTNFTEAKFLKNANFSGANFFGSPIFELVFFYCGANFMRATFSGSAFFKGATFSGDVSFELANFSQWRVGFERVSFIEEADFARVTFRGEVSFAEASFSKRAIFYDTLFSGKAFFIGTIFFDETTFEETTFSKEACFVYAEFRKNIEFNVKDSNYIDLEKSLFERNILLPQIEKIKVLKILNAEIKGNIKTNWKEVKSKAVIMSQEKTTYTEKAEQFVLLKENFNKQGKYDDEDKAYYEFKKCMEKANFRGEFIDNKIKRAINYIWQGIWYLPKLIVFDWVGGYGTKPRRVFITMIIMILLFAMGYMNVPVLEFNLGQDIYGYDIIANIKTIDDAVYYSGITFLTVGHGDIPPFSVWAKRLSIIEGFLGIFLMSYFTISCVRKLLR